MVHPESPLKIAWDIAVLAVAVAAAVVFPLASVFSPSAEGLLEPLGWVACAVFVADILLTLRTQVWVRGRMLSDPREVAGRYLRSWLWVDVIAALPLVPILGATGAPATLLARLLRLNPLIKLLPASRTLHKAKAAGINPAILRLFILMFWILLAVHWIACGWILVAPEDLDPVSRYIRAFYWTVTTVATIGYGDITPKGNGQTLYVILIEVAGAAMYGTVIANIAALVSSIDLAKVAHREKLDRINSFLSYRNISPPLRKKINEYYDYLWESRRGHDETAVLADLPDPLRLSVSMFLNKRNIGRVPLFEKAGDDLVRDIVMNLEPVVFTPGDAVVRAGEIGFDMYFVSRGSVDVESADGQRVYATLGEGQFFGEIALLLSTPRTATVRAREYCDLYRLDKANFDHVVARYPDFAASIRQLAESRHAEHQTREGKI